MEIGDCITILTRALTDLRKGQFILVYDNEAREGETDFVIASQFLTPPSIQRMRKDGGGLIILMIAPKIAHHLQLPFLADVYADISDRYPLFRALVPNDIPYDTKSSFSISINHRETFTGITDNDRCMTMKRFAALAESLNNQNNTTVLHLFGKEFRSPGHVPICIASEHLLQERKGHTELVVALLQMAGLTPVGSGCEIMGNNGKALSKKDAQAYAKKHKFIFLEGNEIIKAWNQWSQ